MTTLTHPADLAQIAREAAILCGRAEDLGVTLTISQQPLQPLAMGNTRHHVMVRPARGRYRASDVMPMVTNLVRVG